MRENISLNIGTGKLHVQNPSENGVSWEGNL